MSSGPKVLVDLDGTLAKYNGWKGASHIGEPIPKTVELVRFLLGNGYTVEIFTARMSDKDPVERQKVQEAVMRWTKTHVGTMLFATCVKDFSAIAIIDDRAIQCPFNEGVSPDEFLKAMRP